MRLDRNERNLILIQALDYFTAWGVSRIMSLIGVYLFIYFGDQVKLAKTWLLFLPVLPLVLGLLLYLYERAAIKIGEELTPQ